MCSPFLKGRYDFRARWNLIFFPYIYSVMESDGTYDHRLRRIGHPVRSAIHKPQIGRLVVGWVTTSESLLLYVFSFCIFFAFLTRSVLIVMRLRKKHFKLEKETLIYFGIMSCLFLKILTLAQTAVSTPKIHSVLAAISGACMCLEVRIWNTIKIRDSLPITK